MIFCPEVIEQFHCKLLLSSESAKAEAIVIKLVKQRASEFMVIWFKLISKSDFSKEKLL